LNDGGGVVGENASSSNNELIVAGAGSMLNSRLGLHVGEDGSANRLIITNGGFVGTSRPSGLGFGVGGNNEAVVTGSNSIWSNPLGLSVGDSTPGNRLVVTNGGQVASSSGSVGGFSSNNVALVTGVNSVWTNQADLYVGQIGSSNLLVVT